MNPRSTAVLFVVALLLGAFVYFYEIAGEQERREAAQAEKRIFPGIDESEITSVDLTTSDGKAARLESRDGAWRVVAPLEFPADEVTADGIASTLSKLSSEGVIDDPQARDVYGLGESASSLRFHAGDRDRTLTLGKKTPLGSNSYVAADGDERVFMVPTWRLNSFQKSLDELRDRRVLRFDRATVDRFEVKWPGGGVTLEKRDGDWWMTAPVEGRADPETVEDLLSELSFLRADGFVDDASNDGATGLAKPELEVDLQLTGGDGAKRTLDFVLGQVRSEGDRLARGSEPTLYRVPAERINDFPRTVVSYRFKKLANFEASDARRFEITFSGPDGETTIVGQLGDEGWSTSPEAMPTDKASGLVTELSRLKAQDIVAESAGDAELAGLGLAPPRVRFRVFGDAKEEGGSGTLLADVSFGQMDPKLGIIARSGNTGPIYRIDHALAEHLPVSLEAFRNRFAKAATPPATEDAEPDEFSEDPTLQQGAEPRP